MATDGDGGRPWRPCAACASLCLAVHGRPCKAPARPATRSKFAPCWCARPRDGAPSRRDAFMDISRTIKRFFHHESNEFAGFVRAPGDVSPRPGGRWPGIESFAYNRWLPWEALHKTTMHQPTRAVGFLFRRLSRPPHVCFSGVHLWFARVAKHKVCSR